MSFADLLNEFSYTEPYKGQILEGTILRANEREVLLDVGLKRDAIVPRTDLDRLGDDVRETLLPGTAVTTYVLQPSDAEGNLIVSINKGLELAFWQQAEALQASGQIVEVEIVGLNRGGLLARLGRLTGFIPMSQVTSIARFTSDDEMQQAKGQMIGHKLSAKVIEVDRLRNRLIFSERAARTETRQQRLAGLQPGTDTRGTVVGLVDFGAFVDLGGVDGLIHISKLDHKFVRHPGEVLKLGDEVDVRIESIDEKGQRISLNRKVLLPDPWTNVAETYHEGALVPVTISSIQDFGVFGVLPNGLQGLIHNANMTKFDVTNIRSFVREGDALLTRVVSLDTERQRIGLSLDDVTAEEEEAWLQQRREAQASQN